MPKGKPPIDKQFAPGQSGNPGGKPVGARNRITGDFLKKLADDFEAHGKVAIETARTEDPVGYIRVVASLLPKEFRIERPTEGLSDDELTGAIDELRSRFARVEGAGDGTSAKAEPKPPRPVSSLH